jgi:hypothetical protein
MASSLKQGKLRRSKPKAQAPNMSRHTAHGPCRSGALAAIYATTETPRHQAHRQTPNMRIRVFAPGGAEIQMLISSCVSKVSVT